MTGSMPTPPAVDVNQILGTAAQVFRATLSKCLPFAMMTVVAAQLPSIYWMATGHEQITLKPPADPTVEVLALIGAVFQILLCAAMMVRQRALIGSGGVNAAAELGAALGRLPVLVAGFFLALLAIAAGTVLLVLPGIFLAVCFSVAMPVVLFEGLGPYAALVRSVRLVRPLWWKTLATLVIAALVVFVCVLVFAAFLGIFEALLPGQQAVLRAIETASMIGVFAVIYVFCSALLLVLHSASSSA